LFVVQNFLGKAPSASSPRVTSELIESYKNLGSVMLEVCNKAGEEKELMVDLDFPKLNECTRHKNVLIPLQSSLMVTLPAVGDSLERHRAFEGELPMIKGFRNQILVMTSLAKPKKVTVMGTDDKDYHFLLKPKDDLRKDNRFNEFNSVVNKLFKKDPEARKRRLRKPPPPLPDKR